MNYRREVPPGGKFIVTYSLSLRLQREQIFFLTKKSICNQMANFLLPDQFMNLRKARPSHRIGLTRTQHNGFQRNLLFQAVKIKMSTTITTRSKKMKFLLCRTNPRLLKEFSPNCLKACLSSQNSASRVLPGARKTLLRGSSG